MNIRSPAAWIDPDGRKDRLLDVGEGCVLGEPIVSGGECGEAAVVDAALFVDEIAELA